MTSPQSSRRLALLSDLGKVSSGIHPISGRYVFAQGPWNWNDTQFIGLNTVYLMPFLLSRATTFDRAAFHIATAGTESAAVRVGMYRDAGDGKPGSLVFDAGAVSATVPGDKSLTINNHLAAGRYFTAFYGYGWTTTAPKARNWATNGPTVTGPLGGTLADTWFADRGAMSWQQTDGTLPATAPSALNYASGSPPYWALYWRAV